MSISKTGKTGPTAGLIDYLVRESDAKIIGGNLPLTKRAMLAQSSAWNRLRPELQSNTIHLIESYAPDEQVSDEIAVRRAEEKLKRLDLKNVPFSVIRHTDKEHYQHIHILASRIRLDGSVFDDSNLALRSIVITKELDAEFGMQQTPFYFRAKRTRRQEYEMMRRTGEDSNNEMLCKLIDRAVEQSGANLENFLLNLEREEIGFWLYLNESQTGIKGISFDCRQTNHANGIKGSQLGDGYSFSSLAKRIDYDEQNDFPQLVEKYSLVAKSALPATKKKSRKNSDADTFVLIFRPIVNSFDRDEKSEELIENFLDKKPSHSNDFQSSAVSEITRAEVGTEETEKTNVEVSKNKISAANWSSLDDSFEGNQADINTIKRIEKNEFNKFKNTAASNSPETNLSEVKTGELVIIPDAGDATGLEVFRLGYEQPKFSDPKIDFSRKDTAENGSVRVCDDGGISKAVNYKIETDEAASVPSPEIVKTLQNEIDYARESSTTFSEFLIELQLQGTVCLPENDDSGKTIDLIFIKQEIDVSSGELEEYYQFPALVEKLDYPDRSNFISASPPFDYYTFQAEAVSLHDKPLSEYWWKMKAEADEAGRVKVNPAAFELLRCVYQHTFQKDIEDIKNIESSFDKPSDVGRFLETLDVIEKSNVIYEESITSVSKIIKESRQTLGNGTLIFTADGASKPPIINSDLSADDSQKQLREEPLTIRKRDEENSKSSRYEIEAARQLGRELVAELAFKAALCNQNKFIENVDDKRFQITVHIGRGKEAREISRADLRRECLVIAQGNVAETKKVGLLQGIAADEGISLEKAEQNQLRREIQKARKFQNHSADALERMITLEGEKLSEETKRADLHFQREKSKTAVMAEQSGIINTQKIKPLLPPEIVWLEQVRAVARGDAETFTMLEGLHQATGLPRPNAVYARLRAAEAITAMQIRADEKIALENLQPEREASKIVVNLRRENG